MTSSEKSEPDEAATLRYDQVAHRWRDKMRSLGYYDAYLGFLSARHERLPVEPPQVIDIGAGTAAFSEAWVAVRGRPRALTLLDPSQKMLDHGMVALRRRNVEPRPVLGLLGEVRLAPVDVALAAHVIEHCPDPATALGQIARLLRPGGKLYLAVSKPHWCNAIIWLQWRHRTFRKDEILQLVGKAGFDIDGTHSFPAGPPSRTSQGIFATRTRHP